MRRACEFYLSGRWQRGRVHLGRIGNEGEFTWAELATSHCIAASFAGESYTSDGIIHSGLHKASCRNRMGRLGFFCGELKVSKGVGAPALVAWRNS